MAVPKTDETLHNYLRRHFKKISEGKARQFAEQGKGSNKILLPVPRSSDGGSHRG
jgi:hypothetical protein